MIASLGFLVRCLHAACGFASASTAHFAKPQAATLLLLALSGCAPYAQVQMQLVDQSRKGIEHARATQTSYAQVVEQLHELQRKRLDDAFDADVLARPAIDAAWVIDHRRAYAAAVDAMAERRFTARQSAMIAQQNLDAIDQALDRLKWLQSIPLSWFEESVASRTP